MTSLPSKQSSTHKDANQTITFLVDDLTMKEKLLYLVKMSSLNINAFEKDSARGETSCP